MFSRVFCKIREETTNDDRSSYPKVVGSNPSSATKNPWKFNASRVSFLFGAGRKSQFVEYLWNDDQINGAVVIFLKVIYINIIIDYCVQRQVDLIYMTPEYMAELGVIISKTATGEQRPAKNSNNYVFSL